MKIERSFSKNGFGDFFNRGFVRQRGINNFCFGALHLYLKICFRFYNYQRCSAPYSWTESRHICRTNVININLKVQRTEI